MARIEDKKTMYELYHSGAFGNMLKAWPNLDAFREDVLECKWPLTKKVALRLSSKPGIEPPLYCQGIYPYDVIPLVESWAQMGISKELITVNELGRDDAILLQGEVQRSERYFDLRCSNVKKVMRLALNEGQSHYSGLQAKMILNHTLDSSSWENMNRLFDEYPDSVIEFSTYSVPVGTLQLNTVFWEVRNY